MRVCSQILFCCRPNAVTTSWSTPIKLIGAIGRPTSTSTGRFVFGTVRSAAARSVKSTSRLCTAVWYLFTASIITKRFFTVVLSYPLFLYLVWIDVDAYSLCDFLAKASSGHRNYRNAKFLPVDYTTTLIQPLVIDSLYTYSCIAFAWVCYICPFTSG